MAADPAGPDVARQRGRTMRPIAIAAPVAVVAWCAIAFLAPPLPGMEDMIARLVLAVKCLCVAILFCLVTGVEAIAHERLRSPAIDPLSGYETPRMRINLRYLQNTLEQTVIFIPAVLGLAIYSPGGGAMRAVIATIVVWIAARLAFWIGYHRSPLARGLGAPGMALSMLVLLYVCARFGFDIAGPAGAVLVLALFGAVEAVITWGTKPLRT